jgi:phosphoglycolate phosphatase-like HAD superfamily hydrolase
METGLLLKEAEVSKNSMRGDNTVVVADSGADADTGSKSSAGTMAAATGGASKVLLDTLLSSASVRSSNGGRATSVF